MKFNSTPTDENSVQWLPVAVAAARLAVSERTVQRRAASGKLQVREVSDEQGKRLLIRVDLPTGADNLPTPNHAQNGEAADTSRVAADKVPTPADTTLTAHLLSENTFLRSVIEQLQRDGAETRAALRKALESQPKQLTEGDEQSARTAPQRPQNGAANTKLVVVQNAPEAKRSGPTTYASIADMLERELNR